VKTLLEDESAYYSQKAGVPVPVPKIRFEEQEEMCKNTSCTIMDAKNPVRTTQIFYNPKQFSPRTVFHEWHHYMASVLGPEKTREVLGPEFTGDADSEEEADKFALAELKREFPERMGPSKLAVAADSRFHYPSAEDINMVGASKGPMQQLTVYRQGGSNVFDGLAKYYDWASPYLGVSGADLNMAYTPELLGTILETGLDIVFTPFAAIVWNAIAGVILNLAASLDAVGGTDKRVLIEMGAHEILRLVTLANPQNLQAASREARSIGPAIGQGQFQAAFRAGTKTDTVQQFRSAFAAVQQLLGPIARGAAPGTGWQSSHGANIAQQPSYNETGLGAPPFQ